ncbi:MAG TPA: class I tRNA ligase family protein [Acidimicrobiales bacterium]|nr:class I tRNA ligase family protein [Acidimicrobiales bacterium]
MPDALRLITSPLPVAAGLGYADLSAAVAADALARRRWAAGRPASLVLQTLTGDLGGRLAFDRDLVRTGHDRSTLPPQELAEAVHAFDASRRRAAAEQLDALGVTAELDEGGASPAAREAAAIAFVRLHEEGLIDVARIVAPFCPSCATVIEGPDAVAGHLEVEVLRVAVDADLVVEVTAPELVDGTVGVAVPVGHPAAGRDVVVPLVEREVPVVEEPGCVEPRLLVPAHDASAFELAELHGFVPIRVLGRDGVVRGEGPLAGLSRFAARRAATALLQAEGAVVDTIDGTESVDRCRHCGSVAVPVLGWHWLLRVAQLEVAAADAIRHGSVSFVPAAVRDTVLVLAGGRPWCLDRSTPGGTPLPVSRCTDCRRVTVAVDAPSTCGKCFGELEPSRLTLDARFVAALAPLVRAGWPGRISADQVAAARATTAVVAAGAIESWALPALALGLRLAGYAPFSNVVVQPLDVSPATEVPPPGTDRRAARLALLAATDVDAAVAAVAALDTPIRVDENDAPAAAGSDTSSALAAVEAAVAALDEGGPGQAAALLVAALTGGVPSSAADRVQALAVPFLGA